MNLGEWYIKPRCVRCSERFYPLRATQRYCSQACFSMRPNRAMMIVDHEERLRLRQLVAELREMRAEMEAQGYPTMRTYYLAGLPVNPPL